MIGEKPADDSLHCNTKENYYSSESVGLIVARRPRGGAWGLFSGGGEGVPQLKNGARGVLEPKKSEGGAYTASHFSRGVH